MKKIFLNSFITFIFVTLIFSAGSNELFLIKSENFAARGVCVNPQSNGEDAITTGHDDGTLRCYHITGGRLLWKKKIHSKEILSLRYSSSYIITTSLDGTAVLTDMVTRNSQKITGHHSWVFDSDYANHVFTGKYVFTVSRDKHLRIYKINDNSLEQVFNQPVHAADVNCVRVYTPDHSYYNANNTEKGFIKIITGSDDRTLKIWHWEDGKKPAVEKVLTGHKGVVYTVDIFEDKLIAAGDWANEIIIYNFQGKILKRLNGYSDGIMKIIFLDDKRVISASKDKMIKIWDINTGRCLSTFTGHKSFIYSIALTPRKDKLVSVSRDNTIRIWDLKNILSKNDYNRMLLEAILNSDFEGIKKAVSGGADVNTNGKIMTEWVSQNNLSMYTRLSALAIAETRNNAEIIRYLKSRGARSYRLQSDF